MKHGGDLAEARRLGGDGPWLDMSTGINPHPWPIPPALLREGWTRLPGRDATERLLEAARAAYGVAPEAAIAAAPGTQALIQWLPRLAPDGRVAILGPTYGEHERAWRLAGRAVLPCGQPEDLPGAARNAVLVSPNNPDGRVASPAELDGVAERCAARGGWLVVDESFADVVQGASGVGRPPHPATVILRSFGKFYGLAGLRLGFAVGPPGLIATMEAALGPWCISGPALAIGAAALADHSWADAMRLRLAAESKRLDAVLAGAGVAVVGGTTLYRLARVPDAAAVHAGLARRHVWTRRFDWVDDLLRFGLPPEEDGLARLAVALPAALAEAGHRQGTSTGSPPFSAR